MRIAIFAVFLVWLTIFNGSYATQQGVQCDPDGPIGQIGDAVNGCDQLQLPDINSDPIDTINPTACPSGPTANYHITEKQIILIRTRISSCGLSEQDVNMVITSIDWISFYGRNRIPDIVIQSICDVYTAKSCTRVQFVQIFTYFAKFCGGISQTQITIIIKILTTSSGGLNKIITTRFIFIFSVFIKYGCLNQTSIQILIQQIQTCSCDRVVIQIIQQASTECNKTITETEIQQCISQCRACSVGNTAGTIDTDGTRVTAVSAINGINQCGPHTLPVKLPSCSGCAQTPCGHACKICHKINPCDNGDDDNTCNGGDAGDPCLGGGGGDAGGLFAGIPVVGPILDGIL